MKEKKTKVCMIVQDKMVKGGIAAVISGYYGSKLEQDYDMIYVESYKDGGKLTKLFKGICGYFHFAKVLLRDRPDIVHMHSSFGPSFYRSLPFIYMASWAKKPMINHIHGSEFDKFYTNASEQKKRLVRKAWGECDRFIVLSESWKERFSEVIPTEKMTVIENYSIVKGKIGRSCCHNQVLFLGAINQMKGCYDMVDVIKRVAEVVPDIKMVVAGAGEIEQVKAKAAAEGAAEYFVFPGWVRREQKERLLEESDVFFLPSYTEGMPMSVLDAMGYGLPIVTTNVGGIPRIVHEGKNGFMCEPGNTAGFAEAITQILTESNMRKNMGKHSLAIVKGHYSLENHLEEIGKVYQLYGREEKGNE